MNRVAEYINYRRKAKKRHGIHSPYIYGISDICFRQGIDGSSMALIQTAHQYFRSNNEQITVTDLGAGSHKLKTVRKVKDIYRVSSSKGKYGLALTQLVSYFKVDRMLELGTSIGVGSTYLMAGNQSAHLITIEGCPETAKVASRLFKALNLDQIDQRIGDFKGVLGQLPESVFDLIFLDGHHDGQATLDYVERLIPFIHEETVIILDDIRWSDGMLKAWNTLIKDERFHVTIDLFRMGIIVLRSSQRKEHFTLRL